jgi:hypothetical protein
MFCPNCGKEVSNLAVSCPGCGHPLNKQTQQTIKVVSQKSRLAVVLLCLFLGWFGIHRFYVGKIGTGILWLFTGGLFGLGWVIDFIVALCGSSTDKSGAFVENW